MPLERVLVLTSHQYQGTGIFLVAPGYVRQGYIILQEAQVLRVAIGDPIFEETRRVLN
jgi:hypothetical protein